MSTFTEERFGEIIDSEIYDILVYTINSSLLGYVIVNLSSSFESESNGFEVDPLFVQQHFQGKGIGQSLLLKVKELHGASFGVSTRAINQKAIRFYKRFAFKIIRQIQLEVGGELDTRCVLTYSEVV